MIKNERHPSWVSFVTIFLPVPNTAPVPPAPAAAGATPEEARNHAPQNQQRADESKPGPFAGRAGPDRRHPRSPGGGPCHCGGAARKRQARRSGRGGSHHFHDQSADTAKPKENTPAAGFHRLRGRLLSTAGCMGPLRRPHQGFQALRPGVPEQSFLGVEIGEVFDAGLGNVGGLEVFVAR